ncbi:MAG: APC family permease [Tannerella sp.]|jgi:amino acid transporter|nr:APC family permease [Tannerella sp.]
MVQQELKKKLGFWSCLSVGVGLVVASSTLITLGQGAGIAGAGFIIAMFCAWVLQHFSAQSYAELACMMPSAGGIRSYTRVAMGALPAVVATISGFVIPNLLAAPTELAVASTMLSENFTSIFPPIFWGVMLLVIIMATNIIGIDIFAKFQIVFTVTMMVILTALGVIGLMGLGRVAPTLPEMPFNPMGWDVLGLTAMAVWLYIGIEYVCPLAEETVNPGKNLPRAMIIGLLLIFGVNIIYMFASLKYVPMGDLFSSNTPHLLVAEAILGKEGLQLFAIVSISASLSTLNTVIGVVPRILYGMGINRELPRFFGYIHKNFRTPVYGILFMCAATALFFVGGVAEAENLIIFIMAACCSWFLCYIIAHVNVIILRKRYPDVKRPYRTTFYPVPQIVGIIGMVYCILHIAPLPELAAPIYKIAGAMLLMAAAYAVLWLKYVTRTKLFSPLSMDEARQEWDLETRMEDVDIEPAGTYEGADADLAGYRVKAESLKKDNPHA